MSLRNWFHSSKSKQFGTSTRSRKAKRSFHYELAVEKLEDRLVPTGVAVPSGLVSWWTGNSTGADAMGLNNATLNNGATYSAGEVSKGFSFDGINDRVTVADSDSLKFTGSMTIEGWLQVRGLPTGTGGDDHSEIFFRGDDRGGLDPYSLSIEPNGTLKFLVTNQANASASVAAPISQGQFIHVAATLDDATGTMRLYENGAVVAQQVTALRPFRDLDPASNPSIGIGNHGGYPTSPHNFPFYGQIDELSAYNRALTSTEVFGIFKAGSDGKVVSPIAVSFPAVVEGSAGTTTPVTFTIQRTGSTSGALAVNWATADDTAKLGLDYFAASGSVTFAPGETLKTVQVTVVGDNTPETNETFKLVATPVGGTAIMGLATIFNDEAAISIGNASANEGDSSLRLLDRFVTDGSGGLTRPRGSVFGPDGNLYVVSADTNSIVRFNSVTGSYINTFVASGSGGLNGPIDLAFGPNGSLYVTSNGSNQLLRYDGSTGAFLDVAASGLSSPQGITAGPDGSLYIANMSANQVLRYNTTGMSVFVAAGSGGIGQPRKAVFGPDANGDSLQDLYVTNEVNGTVLRFDGRTGAYIDTIVSTGTAPGNMWLGIGSDGVLYVSAPTSTTSGSNKSISRYNPTTGALLDTLPLGRDGWAFQVGAGNIIYDSGTSAGAFIDRIGPSSIAAFTVSLSSASALPTTVNFSSSDGTALAGSDYQALLPGTLQFAPGETTKIILVQTLDDAIVEPTETFNVTLSTPTNGVLVNSTGIGTIIDNDATKFYVVDDAAVDRTYRYGVAGNAQASGMLGAGNTAPLGVAANAAGTTLWVVDANKNVYVYNVGLSLLGSWTAGSVTATAKLEGVATNGTDIWIVDAKQAKVFGYAGAASRLSGSQNATTSFSLNSADTNPMGIVTDGVSLWVVDDGSRSDKVFKYSLSGSLLGSWTIDAANASPTGLTINPANVSDIWIVDGGAKKVFQYTASTSRTSGSQTAAATFALAAGNTDPQDIADPPAPGMRIGSSVASPVFVRRGLVVKAVAEQDLSSRDALFAMLVQKSALSSATPNADHGMRTANSHNAIDYAAFFMLPHDKEVIGQQATEAAEVAGLRAALPRDSMPNSILANLSDNLSMQIWE